MADWTRRRLLGASATLIAGVAFPRGSWAEAEAQAEPAPGEPAAAALSGESDAARAAAIAPEAARPEAPDPFVALDALGQAALVAEGEASPEELVEAAIARAARLDPELQSIVTPMFEQARARLALGLAEGPFSGVPTLVKDLLPIKGVPQYNGSRLFLDHIATETNVLVERMEAAGMVVIGKSSTPEFGLLPTTSPRAFPPTRNPWDTERDPGGSSGGAGAAVAAGIVPIAQGSDGGGSIRIPSSACGLFGMKPSRGRLPAPPDPRPVELSVRGFLTRTVRDSQAALAAFEVTGFAFPSVADEALGAKRRLRIAFTTEAPDGAQVDPECAKAVERTAKLCRSLGHRVEEVKPPFHDLATREAMVTLWASGPHGLVAEIEAKTGEPPPRPLLEPWTWGLVEFFRGREDPDAALIAAVEQALRATEAAATFHDEYDVLLTSTLGAPPLPSGQPDQSQPFEALLDEVFDYVPDTYIANMTGRPAMSVPLYTTKTGLPLGSHFVGRFGEEALLYRLARELEEARPWRDRWPPALATWPRRRGCGRCRGSRRERSSRGSAGRRPGEHARIHALRRAGVRRELCGPLERPVARTARRSDLPASPRS